MNGNVLWLGLVSLLTDASSEMVIPLLPLFLTTTLHAGPLVLGGIEGAAEMTASLLKLASGRVSDRWRRRVPLVLAGYGISTVARPLVAVAATPLHVLIVRLMDRTGKGIRTSPRDALLAGSVPTEQLGRAYGFHRAMDHFGAVLGPLLALLVLQLRPGDLRAVFACAAIPGILGVAAIVAGVREVEPTAAPSVSPDVSVGAMRTLLPVLAPIALFTLGNASDTFLLLRAGGETSSIQVLPVLWMAFHVVKVVASLFGGRLADHWNRRSTILAGWTVYALVYAGFAVAESQAAFAALFVVYGLYHGLTEGAEKSLVARLAPEQDRGAAFGWYHLVVGVVSLPASLLFGAIWELVDERAAFLTGAGLAVSAMVAMIVLVPRERAI